MLNQENQTQFTQSQPLYENPVVLPGDPLQIAAWQKRKRLVLIIGAVCLIVLAILVLLILMTRSTSERTFTSVTNQPTPTIIPDNSLTGRILSTQKELQAISQTEYQLPLPQVDFNLRLEEKKQ